MPLTQQQEKSNIFFSDFVMISHNSCNVARLNCFCLDNLFNLHGFESRTTYLITKRRLLFGIKNRVFESLFIPLINGEVNVFMQTSYLQCIGSWEKYPKERIRKHNNVKWSGTQEIQIQQKSAFAFYIFGYAQYSYFIHLSIQRVVVLFLFKEYGIRDLFKYLCLSQINDLSPSAS